MGDRKGLRTKIFRPCRGSLNAISYPGACAPGYYLSAPPGLCREGSDGISRQILTKRHSSLSPELSPKFPTEISGQLIKHGTRLTLCMGSVPGTDVWGMMECGVACRVRSREAAVSKTDTPWTAGGPSHIGIGIQQLAKLNF